MCQTTATSSTTYGTNKSCWESKWDMLFDKNCKQWISFNPAFGLPCYPCYSCKNLFSTKRSLLDHINRRAVVFKYSCPGCANTQTFYNRCSLLMHARTHYTMHEGSLNLSHVEIAPLPLNLAGFFPHKDIPLLYDDVEVDVADNLYLNTQFYYPSCAERGKEVVTMHPVELYFSPDESSRQFTLALKQNSSNVPRCIFIDIEQQKQIKDLFLNDVHLTRIKEEVVDESYTIPVISRVESLSQNDPLEMGANIDNGRTSPEPMIKTHEVINLPKCPECHQPQKIPMNEHFIGNNVPLKEDLKCQVCKFVASTKCSLRAHLRIHDYLAPFICPECGKEFANFNDLGMHMDDQCFHLAKGIRFRCPGKKCGKLFALTQTYAAHFEVHMQSVMKCSSCKGVFQEDDFALHKLSHAEPCFLLKHYRCTVCTEYTGTFTENNAKLHIQMHTKDRERCMYVYTCRNCRSYFRSTTTYSTHMAKCTKNSHLNGAQPKKSTESVKYVHNNCRLCNIVVVSKENNPAFLCSKCRTLNHDKTQCKNCKELIVYREGNPAPHCSKCGMTQVIEIPKKDKKYYCILCNQQLLKHEKATHMRQCKFSRPVVVMDKIKAEPSEESGEESATDCPPSESMFRPCDSENDEEPNAKKRKRVYRCRLCYHKETERAPFHAHIIKHRDVQTSYQCMECGECFVVKPSLEKHLMHYHHILDTDNYLSDNDCFDKKALEDLSENMKLTPGECKDVKENQCRVCREQFPDEATHDKHFRTHGMAFLMKKTAT
ncbi:unnamed protein product [Brassicogethes aeneus]|uniref:C2H2-type domain-containing protein n=1 Tax=Brassicogethes aeneus TaxID=1431903 RepID=A0A9P0B4U0_BRAAE|nr:unnamed protein product [Brassicogethes aeneus]